MQTSRVPDFADHSFDGMLHWFAALSVRGLLFHPDDSPSEIISVADGKPVFTNEECRKIDGILASMFEKHGNQVHEACYPIFMRAFGQHLDT